MTVADALMLALGVIAVGSGALVVTSAHLVRAGFYLVVSLGAVAGLYLVLGAELVAWVQVLVYVGAVVVLLLFAVMLTRAPIGPSPDLDRPAGPAALIGAGVGLGLSVLLLDAFRWTRYDLPPPGTGRRVGEQIFGAWVLPFEVLSILLLAALVGAIVLSRPDIGARPGPEGADVVAPPSPTGESAEVVARLERIAARQAAAQARVRAQHAAEAAAANQAAAEESGGEPAEPTRDDVLREQARNVVFRAREAGPALGGEDPPAPETGPRRVENTVGEPIPDDEQPALPPAPPKALPPKDTAPPKALPPRTPGKDEGDDA
ncbi:hypothetical protein Ade02nite_26030 [Paractinoplanes deccanensis]|uniref:NADH-quinone oxidoreductase subunit J n=1 Tax=Paractinoplanes deccanensis TaxID=113561 RepID=A0ABQ3Y1U1_9ACTN|nr:hypothetical protein Ade02nite_26030 [Actinoplanes deccanensis]